MKEYAAKLLRGKGCDRIEFEYPIIAKGGQRFFLDVVGFEGLKASYAVECGDTGFLRMEKLEGLFNHLIELSYEDFIYILLNENKILKEQIEHGPVSLDGKIINSVRLDPLGDKLSVLLLDEEGNLLKRLPVELGYILGRLRE